MPYKTDRVTDLIIKKDTRELNFTFILWAIITLIFLLPIIRTFSSVEFLFNVGITVVFMSGIAGLSSNRKRMAVALAFYVPMFYSTWSDFLPPFPLIKVIGNLSGVILACGLLYFILKTIINARKISADLLKAAITAYLLMGFTWTLPYLVLALSFPDSFTGLEVIKGSKELFPNLLYFSFTTLSTLGYGDICPVSGIARSLAILEALAGQLYLVVVISWMVGLKVGQDMKAEQ